MKRLRLPVLLGAALLALSASASAKLAVFTRPVVREVYEGPWLVEIAAHGFVESSVLDQNGKLVAGPFAAKTFVVPEVKVWSAETPVCYRLVTVQDGERTETVFGFAEKVLRDRRLFVNGRPVRLKLGPKGQNGNTVSAVDCAPETAWTEGLYRLSLLNIARLDVMRPLMTPGATRHRFQDWTVKATNFCQRIVVANRNSFLSASDVELRWTLLRDGRKIDAGRIDLLGLKPGQETSFDMPPPVIAARYGTGTVSVRFSFRRDGATVAEDQIDLVASRETDTLGVNEGWFKSLLPSWCKAGLDYAEETLPSGGRVRRFTTGATRFTFDEERVGAVTLTKRGVFSDTPLVGAVLPCREGPSPDFFCDVAYPPSPVAQRAGALTFTACNDGEDVQSAARWTVYRDGTVSCRARLRAPGARKGERAGLAVVLAEETAEVAADWFGLGPWSTTPAETEGAFLGRWRADAVGQLTAESVRGIRVGSLTVRTLGAPFAVRLRRGLLELFGAPGADGLVDLAFTLSVDDTELTARSPDGDDGLPDLPGNGSLVCAERIRVIPVGMRVPRIRTPNGGAGRASLPCNPNCHPTSKESEST